MDNGLANGAQSQDVGFIAPCAADHAPPATHATRAKKSGPGAGRPLVQSPMHLSEGSDNDPRLRFRSPSMHLADPPRKRLRSKTADTLRTFVDQDRWSRRRRCRDKTPEHRSHRPRITTPSVPSPFPCSPLPPRPLDSSTEMQHTCIAGDCTETVTVDAQDYPPPAQDGCGPVRRRRRIVQSDSDDHGPLPGRRRRPFAPSADEGEQAPRLPPAGSTGPRPRVP